MKTWYDNLRNAIKKRGMTQAEVAARIGISQPAISQWLSGQRTPSIETIRKLSEILSMSINEMLGDDAVILETATERDLVKSFRELDDRDRETIKRLIESMRPQPTEPTDQN